MPNHVTNTIEIYVWHDEDKETTDKVLKLLRDEDSEGEVIDFAKIVPQPDNLFTDNLGSKEREQCAREGRPNWYDWQCDNWGTKWNAYSQSLLERDTYTVKIQFDTAWSPPTPVIEALEKLIEETFPREKGYEAWVSGAWIEEGYQSAGVF